MKKEDVNEVSMTKEEIEKLVGRYYKYCVNGRVTGVIRVDRIESPYADIDAYGYGMSVIDTDKCKTFEVSDNMWFFFAKIENPSSKRYVLNPKMFEIDRDEAVALFKQIMVEVTDMVTKQTDGYEEGK